jgi:hypothetical protein
MKISISFDFEMAKCNMLQDTKREDSVTVEVYIAISYSSNLSPESNPLLHTKQSSSRNEEICEENI